MNYINRYAADIKKLCVLCQVKTLYAFGSAASNQMTEQSDVDLKNYANNYFNFKFSLQDLFKKPIDLLEEKAIRNPYFKQAVDNQRKLVYEH
jgi:uncharacterized protein